MITARYFVKVLKENGRIITFVESCTGGGLANAITNIQGSSEVLKDSFVTYSNEAKVALGVPQDVIDLHSVYSQACATEMALAGLEKSVGANIAVGITGSFNRVDTYNPEHSHPGETHLAVAWYDDKGEIKSSACTFYANPPYSSRRDSKKRSISFALGYVLKVLS
jgi:PncC family amidohydrolase